MKKLLISMTLMLLFPAVSVLAAYHHGGDTDSDIVLEAYPALEGTKLDSCTLCHTGGEYEKSPVSSLLWEVASGATTPMGMIKVEISALH